MTDILVVGGAGYIGSHMCKYLAAHGHRPVVLDNLVYGHREAVQWGPFVQGSLSDGELLKRIFSDYTIEAVMHFAAYAYVGESVEDPLKYYRNNVIETLSLLQAMIEAEVRCFIFSSSCTVYGEPVEIPISETHPLDPVNPYGRTKRVVEQILDDFQAAYGVKYAVLRYFNAAGADPEGCIGEDHRPETHLIPLVLETALGRRDAIHIFGTDYPTPDGTCIRDYIHVEDLAQAHLLAVEWLQSENSGIFNLGNGLGYSVRQVIETARRVTGKPIPEINGDRRPGDPSALVGSSRLAKERLGWRPKYADLDTIVETAWRWHRDHPGKRWKR